MPQRRLLYLDNSHLSACLWQGGSLHEEGHFPQEETGVAAFSEYLAHHRHSNFYLLADIAEEGFQLETLPYTQGSDRNALLARKLGQYFYGSPLATAVSYGREKNGRRDERFLFTAMTRPQLFEPWLAALRAAEAQLAGVYSVALLGARLLAKLPPVRERCLLATITRGGIRQSYYENGQLKFSRLTQMTATGASEIAISCAAEATKIYQYLLGQRLIARGAPLPLVALVHPAQTGDFLEHCKNNEDLQVNLQDLHAAGKVCGLKTLPRDSHAESLFMHLLAQNPAREQFAQPAERRFFRLWQFRSVLKSAGAVVLLGCLLFAGKLFVDAMQLGGESADIKAQADADMQKYQAIQKTYPPMPAGTEDLRAVVGRFDELDKRSAPLEPLFLAVSRALGESPRVDIDRLQWQLNANPDDNFLAQQEIRTPVGTDKPAAGGMYAIAVVHGLLPTAMATDQRGQLDAVNAFADTLRKDATLKVTILRMPFDIESAKSLKSASEKAAEAAQPKFVIHISRKL